MAKHLPPAHAEPHEASYNSEVIVVFSLPVPFKTESRNNPIPPQLLLPEKHAPVLSFEIPRYLLVHLERGKSSSGFQLWMPIPLPPSLFLEGRTFPPFAFR